MKKRTFLAVMLTVSFSGVATENHPRWGYEGNVGPTKWGKLSADFSMCENGKNQSPINIKGELKVGMEKLQFAFKSGEQKIINNGHAIQVNVSGKNTLWVDNELFTLQQFHFHAPSENEIDGKQFPLEGHFVYQDKNGDLAVVALMFKQGDFNVQLENAWQQMPIKSGEVSALSNPVKIESLLPEQRDYYRFSGSLTTPPCSEGVRWIVLKSEATASPEQIEQFRTIIHHANNRPIQPLNGRIIVN